MSRVYRLAIANIPSAEIVAMLKAAGFSGTIQPGAIGFTVEWGDENGSVVEVASERCVQLMAVVARILTLHHESAAYLTTDGHAPQLLYSDGKLVPLHDAPAMEVAA